MRLFIALELNDKMKDALTAAQDAMYGAGVRGSRTPSENMHLTLAFIGEYPDAGPVMDALAEVVFTPFEIALDGTTGRFSDVWWVGIERSAPLEALARRVRRALAGHQIPFDRKRFSPHITLIRRASGKLPGSRIPLASMSVGAFSLMRSDRGRNGMIYTELGVREAQS